MRFVHRINGRLIAAAALITSTGCASALDEHYRSMQQEWQHAAPPRRAAFATADALFADQPQLDRAALVRAVLERNPTVEARRQAWRAMLSRYPRERAYDDPMVTYELAPLSLSGRVPYGQIAEVSQRVPFPGKLRYKGAAALAEADAARDDYEVTRLDLALTACQLFDRYFAIARSLEINAEHTALLADLKKSALAEYVAGRGSQQDPLQAEVEVAHVEHESIVLASDRAVVAAQLNALLHRGPDAPLPPPPRDLSVGGHGSPPAAVDEALRTRPELHAASARIEGERAALGFAHRDYFPDFTFMTSYNSMWMTPEHQWMIGVSLNVPIQLGRRRAAVDEAEASLARDTADRERLADEVASAVEIARQRLIEASHVVALYHDRLQPLAHDEVAAARAGFTTGRNSFVAVIDAERSLRDIELKLQSAYADYASREAELTRAIGHMPGLKEDRP